MFNSNNKRKEANDKVEMSNMIKRCKSYKLKKNEEMKVIEFSKENTKLFYYVEGKENEQ